MSRHWLPAAVLVGAALVGGITACGGGQSPTFTAQTTAPTTTTNPVLQMSDLKSALQGATAVHVKGTVSDSGSNTVLDVQLNKDGSASGTVGMGGANYPIIMVDKVVYLQFTPDVVKSVGLDPTSAAGQKLTNKWVPSTSKLMASSDLTNSVQPLLDFNQFIGSLAQNLPPGSLKASKSDTVDGVAVMVYTESDGTAYVTTSSPHYLMRLVPSASTGSGQLDFTNWNQPVAVQAPAASDIYTG